MCPPTIQWTVFWQIVNSTNNAGINYYNKNRSSKFSNNDILKGYGLALASGLTFGIGLRKVTASLVTGSGNRVLLLNCLVSTVASGSASYLNAQAMRQAEI